MTMYKRDDYIQLVEQAYFANVTKTNIDAVLNCFTDNCLVSIRHGDNAVRIFRKAPGDNEKPLRDFYTHLCGNFEAWFGDFVHYIDVENSRCASTFTVKLTPKQESDYLSAGTQELQNCNFFHYQNGKIKEMTVYYSNSAENAVSKPSTTTPTGYPK